VLLNFLIINFELTYYFITITLYFCDIIEFMASCTPNRASLHSNW